MAQFLTHQFRLQRHYHLSHLDNHQLFHISPALPPLHHLHPRLHVRPQSKQPQNSVRTRRRTNHAVRLRLFLRLRLLNLLPLHHLLPPYNRILQHWALPHNILPSPFDFYMPNNNNCFWSHSAFMNNRSFAPLHHLPHLQHHRLPHTHHHLHHIRHQKPDLLNLRHPILLAHHLPAHRFVFHRHHLCDDLFPDPDAHDPCNPLVMNIADTLHDTVLNDLDHHFHVTAPLPKPQRPQNTLTVSPTITSATKITTSTTFS